MKNYIAFFLPAKTKARLDLVHHLVTSPVITAYGIRFHTGLKNEGRWVK